MTVYQLHPLHDPRWANLVQRHPRASVFHTPAWLDALKRTYDYTPVAFTTSCPDAELQNGLVCCDVRSWLTGHRLVSLPFSDHCDSLSDSAAEIAICTYLEGERRARRWHHVELRPRGEVETMCRFGVSERFWFHLLDLRPDQETLFRSFKRDSVQRKIQRAEREGLAYEEGVGDNLLRAFYRLLLVTRRRHQLPPQPFAWFSNLATAFGPALKIRVAKYEGRPVAAILTLRHRDTMVYKYGASDAAFHRLGGMHLLLWQTIKDARADRCSWLDLGRSNIEHDGLATFKDRWGAVRSAMTYWRYPAAQPSPSALRTYAVERAKLALGHLPDGCRLAAGRLLYRHVG